MRATDFIRKYGIDAVIHDFSYYFKHGNTGKIVGLTLENEYFEVDGSELKRLVESHELVEQLGGLEQAKSYAIDANACGAFDDENKIKQAIADVEACR